MGAGGRFSTFITVFKSFAGYGPSELPPRADSRALFHCGGVLVFTCCMNLQPWHFGQHHLEVLA